VLIALVASVLATVGASAPAGASGSAQPVTGGEIDWGVKASFRTYVKTIGAGSIVVGASFPDKTVITGGAAFTSTLRAGATTDPAPSAADQTAPSTATYRFGLMANGTSDAAAKVASLESGGQVIFRAHDDALQIVIDHVRVQLDGSTGTLVADITSKPLPTVDDPAPARVSHPDTVLANLDLSSVTPTSANGVTTYTAIPATMAASGVGPFAGFYAEGTPLDPVTLKIRGPLPELPSFEGTPVAGGSLRWALSRQVWSQPSLNQCLEATGGSVVGALTSAGYDDPASGVVLPITSGQHSAETGQTVLHLAGPLYFGNNTQGGYGFKLDNLTFSSAAGRSVLRADVSFKAPGGPGAGCANATRPWSTPIPGVSVAQWSGGPSGEAGEFGLTATPDFGANVESWDPQLVTAVSASLRSHFLVADGNVRGTTVLDASNQPVLSSSPAKPVAPVHLAFEVADEQPSPRPRTDFDGDGRSDVGVFRPSTGEWFVAGQFVQQFGAEGDVPVPGDYDGDGHADVAVFRPSTGQWFVNGQYVLQFGADGDVPVPGDYDGDGTTDVAVFRPSTGEWFVAGQYVVQFGAAGDVPVPGDYDGDGHADVAVFRPSTGEWFVAGQYVVQFGADGDVPVPGDYDADGHADVAVFRPSTGQWFVNGQYVLQFGADGDVPVPGDYDGDGTTDVAIYRPTTGQWYVNGQYVVQFGAAGDRPLTERATAS
jgi:hypothetical protein